MITVPLEEEYHIFDERDFNGDRTSDISLWRPTDGLWYFKNIGVYQWGTGGDVPVSGKYNADALTDIGLWRPSSGIWFILNIGAYQWGTSGDIPLVR